ncbi:MAG: hypothetical protein R3A78_01505 [Polyangiales bacterium]
MAPPNEERPPSDYPPSASEFPGETAEQRSARKKLEHVVRDTLRRGLERGLEAGLGTLTKTDGAIRDLVGDAKVPRELAGYVFSQIDESKNMIVRVVAKEVRDFLQATDISGELQRALTSLSFEIRTEVRFIPNEAGGFKPDVKAKVAPKRSKHPAAPPPPPDGDDESTE